MPPAYIVVAVFVILSLFEPLSMLLFSRVVRRRSPGNPVKNGNYESAEDSIGTRTSTMSEYLYYFPLFIMFEVVTAVVLIWAVNAKAMQGAYDWPIVSVLVVSLFLEFLALLTVKYEREY